MPARRQKYQPETLAEAIRLSRTSLQEEGILDLSGNLKFERHDVLARLGSQRTLKILKLNKSPLISLHTLPPQPLLRELYADGSQLETLTGINKLNRLAVLSLKDTPVSANPNFRLSAIICVGTRLESINGEKVTNYERRRAQAYPPVARLLVNEGWVVQFPPPSVADFRYLANSFGIECEEKDFIATLPPLQNDVGEEIQDYQEGAPKTFVDKMGDLLRPLGFAVRSGEGIEDDIVASVGLICDAIAKIQQLQQDSPA
jgi:hypothetical protein